MLFQLSTDTKTTHSGVLEFTAEEGCVYIPFWMMQNLQIEEGSLLTVTNASLPKATFCKLQAQSVDFLEISNPRAVLEHALRNYSCITEGDIIQIPYNDQNYRLQLRKVEPGPAACIIETDCNVDFEAPVGYVEPEPDYGRNKNGTGAAVGGSVGGSAAASAATSDAGSEIADEKEEPKTRIVNGQIVRPEDQDMNGQQQLTDQAADMMAAETGQTGVQRNAAIPEEAPAVGYWAVAAGDGARLDGKAAPALKDATGQELDIRQLRAEAAAKRAAAAAMVGSESLKGSGKMLNGKEPDASAVVAAPVAPVSKRKSRVGSKYSKLKSSTTTFRGSANSMDTSK